MQYQLPSQTTSARTFELEIKRLADSLRFGCDPSRFHGSGLEYAESRPYVPGDPVKLIDWKVTARTGRPYIKEYEATRQVPVYLLVDTSASMCVGSCEMTKYAWAVRLAAALARVAQERMSAVGLLAAGSRDLRVSPTLSRSDVMRWAHELRLYDFSEVTLLSKRLMTLAAALQSGTLVIVLSDLHDPGAITALEHVAARHEVVVLWLQDPSEVQPPVRGLFRAREAETGQGFVLSRRTTLRHHTRIHEALVDGGIEFLHLPIHEPVIPRVRHFFRNRRSLGHA